MNLFNIRKSFEMKKAKGWPEIYFCIDLHGTIIPSGRSSEDNKDYLSFYEGAKEVLQWISNRSDLFLILWTSTPPERQTEVHEWLLKNGIEVDFWNENPHAKDTPRSRFDKKPYFNVLIDDRASFDPHYDWLLIARQLEIISGDTIIKWNEDNTHKLRMGINKTIMDMSSYFLSSDYLVPKAVVS